MGDVVSLESFVKLVLAFRRLASRGLGVPSRRAFEKGQLPAAFAASNVRDGDSNQWTTVVGIACIVASHQIDKVGPEAVGGFREQEEAPVRCLCKELSKKNEPVLLELHGVFGYNVGARKNLDGMDFRSQCFVRRRVQRGCDVAELESALVCRTLASVLRSNGCMVRRILTTRKHVPNDALDVFHDFLPGWFVFVDCCSDSRPSEVFAQCRQSHKVVPAASP
mmetsp:Transcript_21935/g.46271  ORF Transcript_21935/g.46271 Transcript_21935/m.46271 type:complete len:222 (-) Transcript_21935:666-1331(-)